MKSSQKLFITTLLLTSLVVYLKVYHKENYLESDYNRRNLAVAKITAQSFRDECVVKNNNNTFGNEFIDGFTPYADTIEGYLSNFSFYNDKQNDKIRQVVIEKDNTKIASLVIAIFAPWIVFIALAIVTLFAWLFYCICCCKQCCCCKSKNLRDCCTQSSFVIMLVSVAGLVAVCIIGFIFSGKFPEKVDFVECTVLKFYVDFKYGENTNDLPKWIGLTGITKKIDDISNGLDQVLVNSQGAFDDNSAIQNTKDSYYTKLNSVYDKNKDVKYSSNSNSPAFIIQLGPSSDQKKDTGLIKLEYDQTVIGAVDLMNSLQKLTNELNAGITEGKSYFDSAKKDFEPVNSEFDKIETDYIDKFRDFKVKVSEKLNMAFIGLFAAILALAIFFSLFTTCYCYKPSKNYCRYLAHIVWQFMTIITFVLFLLAAVFGLVGTAFIFAAPFVEVVLSLEGMTTLFDKQTADLVNVCLNGDGNMKKILMPDNTYINNFDVFYNESSKLDDINSQLANAKDSRVVKELISNYEKLQNSEVAEMKTVLQSIVADMNE